MQTKPHSFTRRTFLHTGAGLAAIAGGCAAPPQFRLQHTKGQKVAVVHEQQPVLEYRYDKLRPKTYVHPLFAPNGLPLTVDGPEDHVHLRGVMLAWSGVNGYDFWGEVNPGAHGQIIHQSFERLSATAPATITSLNHWVADGKVLLLERRTIRVPAPTTELVRMEWESELTPHEEPVTLDASKHVYNGLGLRFVPSMTGGSVLNAKGTSEIEQANGEPAEWCAYCGALGSGGAKAGLAIFDAPGNPRHPTPFFVMNERYGYLSAAPTFREPLRLEPGQELRLQYGLVAFLGEPDKTELDRLFQEWRIGK